MDYAAMKSSENGKVVFSSRQKKLSRQNCLLNLNCLDTLA